MDTWVPAKAMTEVWVLDPGDGSRIKSFIGALEFESDLRGIKRHLLDLWRGKLLDMGFEDSNRQICTASVSMWSGHMYLSMLSYGLAVNFIVETLDGRHGAMWQSGWPGNADTLTFLEALCRSLSRRV